MTATLRIFEAVPGVWAFYDGRIAGRRLHSDAPNWLDDGAYELGIASYAVVSGADALVYDTHISLAHAAEIRRHLEGLGVSRIRVVLSHWHDDHVAGNAVFADCEIIALAATQAQLVEHRDAMESAEPPIAPLVLASRLIESREVLAVGKRTVELLPFDIHSHDGLVLWLPDAGVLLAGDTVEDTVTYISEPERIDVHIRELGRLRTLAMQHLLPNHGDPDVIASGGYDVRLLDANRSYLQRLAAGDYGDGDLAAFVAADVASGAVRYFAPYEAVHEKNLAAVKAVASA